MGTYQFTVEFDTEVQEAYVIRGTVRVFRQGNNPTTVFVRGEEGPLDLSQVQTLEVAIPWHTSYASGGDYGVTDVGLFLTFPAFSPEAGRVMFSLPTDSLARLPDSSNTLYVRADGQVIYTALLEIVT